MGYLIPHTYDLFVFSLIENYHPVTATFTFLSVVEMTNHRLR